MHRLTLQRRAPGLRSVHQPDGETVGLLNLEHLDLDQPEFEGLVRRHAEKMRTAGAVEALIKRLRSLGTPQDAAGEDSKSQQLTDLARARAAEKEIPVSVALSEVARENPQLAQKARLEVARQKPSEGMFTNQPRSKELHEAALARAKEKGISYSAALHEIEVESPDLVAAARHEGGLQVKDVKDLGNGLKMVICGDTEIGAVKDPAGWIVEMAKNRSKAKKVSLSEATAQIVRDYPRLAAAARRFAEHGDDRASLRGIAADAGVDQ